MVNKDNTLNYYIDKCESIFYGKHFMNRQTKRKYLKWVKVSMSYRKSWVKVV